MAQRREPKKRHIASPRERVDLVCNEELQLRERSAPSEQHHTGEQADDDPNFDPLVGTVLAAKYEIHALCGRGGMGSVYRAQHFDLKRYVAVKVLHKHLLSHQGISDRFRLSAQAAHALRHPNLVSVTDFGYTQEGQFYLAMDYIEGETLADRIKREHELPIDSFFKVFGQVLSGLRFCHQKGIVHRDIKPSNILITNKEIKQDSIKLVDFGIAKVLPESESSIDHLTQTGELLGSPLYMSPEQCRGAEIDARTDLYALGCVMYEALSGKPPFQGKSAIETLMMQCSQSPPTLYEATGDAQLTEQLDAFIKKALSKDREDRFSSAEEMEAALASIQRFLHLPKVARQRLNPTSQTGTGSQSVQIYPSPSRRKLNFWAVAVITLICTVLLSIAGQDSLKKYSQSLVSQQMEFNPSKEQALDTIKLGVVERKEGNLEGSNKRLTKALSETQKAFGPKSEEYLTALGELAATHIAQAESYASKRDAYYSTAQTELQMVLTGIEALRSSQTALRDLSSVKLVEASATFNLAHIYTSQGNYGAAAPLFEKGFTLIEATQPIDETQQWFYYRYNDFLWHSGRENEAAKLQLSFCLEPWEAKSASEAPSATSDVNGLWIAPHGLCVKLYEQDGRVRGSFSRVVLTQGGGVSGTIDDTKPTIDGTLENGVFKGTIMDFPGTKKVPLILVRIDKYLVWKIPESGRDDNLPEIVVFELHSQSNAK